MDCRFCLIREYGYSNYTIEGSVFECLKNLHPNDGFDAWYGEDERLQYAKECVGFISGPKVEIDCDQEGFNYEGKTPIDRWKSYLDYEDLTAPDVIEIAQMLEKVYG